MWLLVGLGNPGPQYASHRHNVGFMTIDRILQKMNVNKESFMFGGCVSSFTLMESQVHTIKPMEFMNLSGQAMSRILHYYKIPTKQSVVIHDELDLPFGQLQVKMDGGHGGNNGLRSIISILGTEFARVRVGVGRPLSKGDVAHYLLNSFNKEQQKELPLLLEHAASAALSIIQHGVSLTMNRYNGKGVV